MLTSPTLDGTNLLCCDISSAACSASLSNRCGEAIPVHTAGRNPSVWTSLQRLRTRDFLISWANGQRVQLLHDTAHRVKPETQLRKRRERAQDPGERETDRVKNKSGKTHNDFLLHWSALSNKKFQYWLMNQTMSIEQMTDLSRFLNRNNHFFS